LFFKGSSKVNINDLVYYLLEDILSTLAYTTFDIKL
jgi:hypothetical protein